MGKLGKKRDAKVKIQIAGDKDTKSRGERTQDEKQTFV
jgi:hypothetical protein